MKNKLTTLLGIAWLAALQLHGQGTTAFTYQGQLRDGGTNANGAYTMIFALYDAVTDGNQIGSPITTSPTLFNGLFSVNLDFGAGAFNGSARWLDITISNGVAQTLSPRVQVLPTPYAQFAAVAATVTNGAIMNAQLAANAVTDTNIVSVSGSKISGTVASAATLNNGTWNVSVGTYQSYSNIFGIYDNNSLVLGMGDMEQKAGKEGRFCDASRAAIRALKQIKAARPLVAILAHWTGRLFTPDSLIPGAILDALIALGVDEVLNNENESLNKVMVEWLTRAAEVNHVSAWPALGRALRLADRQYVVGIDYDPQKALYWLRKSHDAGSGAGSFELALLLLDEPGLLANGRPSLGFQSPVPKLRRCPNTGQEAEARPPIPIISEGFSHSRIKKARHCHIAWTLQRNIRR